MTCYENVALWRCGVFVGGERDRPGGQAVNQHSRLKLSRR